MLSQQKTKLEELDKKLTAAENRCRSSDHRLTMKALSSFSKECIEILKFSNQIKFISDKTLPNDYSNRIANLHTYIIHKKYIYRYNQAIKLLNRPFPEEKKDFPLYFKKTAKKIQHIKKALELLTLPTATSLTIHSYDQKSCSDQEKRKIVSKKLIKDWDTYITKLIKFSNEIPIRWPKDKTFRLKTLKKIIIKTNRFLDFLQSEKIDSEKHYLRTMGLLKEFCELCKDPLGKKKYLDKLKAVFGNYCLKYKDRPPSQPAKKFEFLSYKIFIQQETSAPLPDIMETALELSQLPVTFKAEELVKKPWIAKVNELVELLLAIKQNEEKSIEKLPKSDKLGKKRSNLHLDKFGVLKRSKLTPLSGSKDVDMKKLTY